MSHQNTPQIDDPRDTLITIRVSRTERAIINAAAKRRGIPVAVLIRQGVALTCPELTLDNGLDREYTTSRQAD